MQKAVAVSLVIAFGSGLYVISRYNYLFFHSLVETFSVLIICVIFVLAWNSRRLLDSHYLLFLGIGTLFAGVLEMIHTFAYKGFGVFPGQGANLPTQLWIAFRYVFSLTYLAAPFFITRRLKVAPVLAAYSGITLAITGSIFLGLFPDCFVEGRGLTTFKVASEYVIIFILLASLPLLLRERAAFDRRVLQLILFSTLASVAAELAFTQYASVYGPANLIGHLFLLASVCLIYEAIVVTGIVEPSSLLFRNLKLSEERARESEAKYRSLFENMLNGFAYQEIVCDESGKPVDYIFLEVNQAFERLTGLRRENILGRRVTAALPGIEKDPADWIGRYGRVALTGKGTSFEQHAEALGRWYSVSAYSPTKNYFVTIFEDITERKKAEAEVITLSEDMAAKNIQLEASREELQSLNEALITVNAQLQGKIEEQDVTNNDLNNFLSGTNIPTIFLDTHFRVKRFTPAMLRLIKLLPSDVDCPLMDMSQENLGPDFISDCQGVLEQLVPLKRELAINGGWYVRAVLPYRTGDNRIEGVVVTYSDVTEIKRAEERARHLASFPQLNPNPVMEVNTSGKVIFANPGMQKVLEELGIGKEDPGVFLPGDFSAILQELKAQKEATIYREVMIGGRVFAETVQLVSQFDVVRIYALDITERKRAEEESIRAREDWERTFASVPDMIAILDNNHTVIRVNESMARRLGRRPEECIGIKCHEAIHGTPVPHEFCPHCRTLKDGREHTQEVHEEHLGMDLLVTTSPLTDKRGKMIGSVHVAHDITERKKAEEAARQGDEQFRTLADSIPNLAWCADADGYITWYNRRWYAYTGTTPEQMEGWGWQSVHDPAVLPEVLERWETSIATGEPFDMEFPLRGADGVFRPFLTRVVPVKDSAGRVFRWFGTNTDITERKRTEESLCASENLLRLFVEHAPASLAMFDREMRYLSLSRRWLRDYGLGEGDLRGLSHYDVFPGIPERWKAIHRRALAGEVVRNECDRFDRADGSVQWLRWEVRPWHDAAGDVAGIVVFSEDITESKKAEADVMKLSEDMAARNVELEDLNTELEAFIYSVSHDLRAPLRTMSAFVGFLCEDYAENLDDQAKEYLTRISRSSAKMSRLIEDLLNLSRLSRQEINRTEVDLSELAASIISGLREDDPGRDVEVCIEDGLIVAADPLLIESVLSNLIGNAWKFSSKAETARIEFGTMEREGKTVYYIRDNGAGFDPQYAAMMFQPFHRLHAAEDFEGTGIGLAIVERVIRRHHGRVWAEGVVGKGATVYFTLG